MHRRTPRDGYPYQARGGALRASGRGGHMGRMRRRKGSSLLLAMIFFVLVMGVYITFDNGRVAVRTETVTVSGLHESLEGFTILHISDLSGARFGPNQSVLTKVLSSRTYHAVCITGDMVGVGGDPYPFYELLTVLAGKPVFFIPGDADPSPVWTAAHGRAQVLADYIGIAVERGAIYVDAPVSMAYRGQTIWFSPDAQLGWDLAGVEEAYTDLLARDMERGAGEDAQAAIRADQYYLDVVTRTKAARAAMKENDLHVMLAHQPLSQNVVGILQDLSATGENTFLRGIDLVLAGHYVNGQWRLPFFGALHVADPSAARGGWFPEQETVSGLTQVGPLTQHISGGLGTAQTSPFLFLRLFNTPEVTLIKLSAEMQ